VGSLWGAVTIENGLLTQTLKQRLRSIASRDLEAIESLLNPQLDPLDCWLTQLTAGLRAWGTAPLPMS